MNNDLPLKKKSQPSLDERFAARPHVYARLQQIADLMDQALAAGYTADEAEARALEQMQQLGGELLQDWAQEKERQSMAASQRQHPGAIKHIKEK